MGPNGFRFGGNDEFQDGHLLVPAVTSLERYFAAQLAMNSGLLVKHHTTVMPHPTVSNRLMRRVTAHCAVPAATGVLLSWLITPEPLQQEC